MDEIGLGPKRVAQHPGYATVSTFDQDVGGSATEVQRRAAPRCRRPWVTVGAQNWSLQLPQSDPPARVAGHGRLQGRNQRLLGTIGMSQRLGAELLLQCYAPARCGVNPLVLGC